MGNNIALAVAVIIVMFWNFFVNRFWTYSDVGGWGFDETPPALPARASEPNGDERPPGGPNPAVTQEEN